MPKDYDLHNWFTYHAPKGDQPERYVRIRDAALVFAQVLVECGAEGPDLTVALQKVREAVMTANAGIACSG